MKKDKKLKILKRLEKILESEHVFLTGGGGVGKSYLCSQLISLYKEESKNVVVLGSTGISAVSVGGITVHSFFVFQICNSLNELVLQDKKFGRKIKELNKILSNCHLLIIDEISMVSSEMMEMIRYRLINAAFKGKLLFVGDFYQLPPVKKGNEENFLIKSIYAFESMAWEYFNPIIIELTKSKRTSDLEFFVFLSKIRVGNIDNETISYFNELRQNINKDELFTTVLFGRNREADSLNASRLNCINSQLIRIESIKKIFDSKVSDKKFESWQNSIPVNDVLELKIGSKVLFCANKKDAYYNGEQGIVKEITKDYIVVEKNTFNVTVLRHEFTLKEVKISPDGLEEDILASFSQFPLKLAYGITIHKSQGMSIDSLICDLDYIFENGQMYVALSRARDPRNLQIKFTGRNLEYYMKKHSQIDPNVRKFYNNYNKILIEEE